LLFTPMSWPCVLKTSVAHGSSSSAASTLSRLLQLAADAAAEAPSRPLALPVALLDRLRPPALSEGDVQLDAMGGGPLRAPRPAGQRRRGASPAGLGA
jgi:hypothetical protein